MCKHTKNDKDINKLQMNLLSTKHTSSAQIYCCK